jgi:hypothetical protein
MCLICGWIYDEAAGSPDHGIAPGHGLGRRADELDLPGVRRAQGRLRDGAGLRPAANVHRPIPICSVQRGAVSWTSAPPVASGFGTQVPAKVLVIDDSNTIRRSAEIFLRQGGTRWCWPRTASTPWPRSTTMPELIFCDILMPRLDGYQTCAIIKRNPRFATCR